MCQPKPVVGATVVVISEGLLPQRPQGCGEVVGEQVDVGSGKAVDPSSTLTHGTHHRPSLPPSKVPVPRGIITARD